MKALVLGVGRMGTAIAYAMDKFGFHVVGMDTNPDAADNIPRKVNLEDGKTPNNEFFVVKDAEDICRGMEAQAKPDVVISSLPYHQTEIVGKWCVDNGVRYCDLGGRVDVSQNINTHAKEKAVKPIFTDLGLAPGWVNILAEEGCRQLHHKIESVKMMVGGLPAIPSNPPLNYAITWSVDGLINEYRDDCLTLENGEVKTVKGMDGLEKVDFSFLEGEELEAFYTSGGASHTIEAMKARGVENCSYKTIRYKGHRDVIRFLIRNANLEEECLRSIFETGCTIEDPRLQGDIVLIKAIVKGENTTWEKDVIVGFDQQFSAMQKATAFSISSVAKMMAEGFFDDRVEQNRGGDVRLPVVLNYRDVPYDEFTKNLGLLGISA